MKNYLEMARILLRAIRRKIREKKAKLKHDFKLMIADEIRLMDKEKGLAPRCSLCPDNIFCTAYQGHTPKEKGEIVRCSDIYSSR